MAAAGEPGQVSRGHTIKILFSVPPRLRGFTLSDLRLAP
jgi:hypothetical protein